MKKTGLYIIIAVLIVSFSSFEANALEPDDTVLRYLNALKNGDIGTIKDSIGGELYKKRKVLLEQNKSYPKFLKKTYRDTEFQIKETTVNKNEALVKVESKFPDGITRFIFYLNKNAEGNWKIFKESAVP
jgi:hypothetical protein